ncbi:MAG: hypothetical protein LC667_02995, partial [Thioalkalivibrio sp.]|nr:hypothetical protein [Thioalkalivibrio sp.]
LPDGSVAVLSGGNHQVHVFDAAGERVRVFGRQGEGPGEFLVAMAMAFVPPDTLLIMDQLELEKFLLDGTWTGSGPGGLVRDAFGPATAVQPFWIAPDRTIFGSALSRERQQAPIPSGVYRPGTGYALLTAGEREPVLLGWYDGIEQERMELGGGTRSIVAPFARSSTVAMTSWSEPKVLVADNERYEIRIFDTDGTLERVVRRDHEPVPVEDRWVEAWKDAQRDMRWTQGQLPVLEQAWNRMTVRETLPPLEGMTLDSLGYLWVIRPGGMPQDPLTFDVFDPDGRYLGDLSVPGGLRPTPAPIIGADYLMGVWADELDVETVRVYPLERGR